MGQRHEDISPKRIYGWQIGHEKTFSSINHKGKAHESHTEISLHTY